MSKKKSKSNPRIVVKIEFGNEAMCEYGHVREAFENSIFAQEAFLPHDRVMRGDGGVIRDRNGNKVGSWVVKD